MGIDLTPNPDNPNISTIKIDTTQCAVPLHTTEPMPNWRDHIIYEAQDGNIFYQYDTETDTFVILNLPMFMRNAPLEIKTETVRWVRKCIAAEREGREKPKSKMIREYLEDPKTKAVRAQMKRGYIALEDYV